MNSIQVTFRDLPYSEAIENRIYEHAEKLNEFNERFINCRVVITVPQKHKHQGKIYNIRIILNVPSKEIVVTHQEDQDINIAIRDAFAALTRQVDEYFRCRRGDVKKHELPLHGFVVRLFPEDAYGFIKGQDGNEYYFSATNIASTDFNHLAVGDGVYFLGESGSDGYQARRVTIEKHNHATS